jgi:hypothetical protein
LARAEGAAPAGVIVADIDSPLSVAPRIRAVPWTRV